MSYDIIGDIHGHAEKLEWLLARLGYRSRNGCWRHPRRKAIFLGDFIDRGPYQLRSVDIPRRMVAEGAALAVMGNHEFNAIAWHTRRPSKQDDYLRSHRGATGAKNRRQHERFLAEVEHDPSLHADIIGWFKTLPLWLDLPGIRIVHACWHQRFMNWLSPKLAPGNVLPDELLFWATRQPSKQALRDSRTPTVFKAAEALTKGPEVTIPRKHAFRDKDGILRDRARVSWWKEGAYTYRTGTDLPEAARSRLPDAPLPFHARIAAPTDKPIFFGHYCRSGSPSLDSDRIACVDFCAGKGGQLAAYRWDGEATLSAKNFVSAE